MTYKYKCGNDIINVFVWSDDFHTDVAIYDKEAARSYDRTIREDKNGKFFTWNRNKIYLDDWIKISMLELKEKIERGEWITSEELCQAILTDGIDNARFIVPFDTAYGIKDTICKVEERFNREVKADYKLVLVPVTPNNDTVHEMEYYTTDLVGLLRAGIVEIADSVKEKELQQEEYEL